MSTTISKYIFYYLLFSAVAYFGSYGILVLHEEKTSVKVPMTDMQVNKVVVNLTNAWTGTKIQTDVEYLEEKKLLFFVYWPIAVKYAYRCKFLNESSRIH